MSRVDAEVLCDLQGVDFGSYLENDVLPGIRAHWYRLVSKPSNSNAAGMKGGEATIEFAIQIDGSAGPTNVVATSGNGELDHLAVEAIEKSAPFPVLPKEMGGKDLRVRGRFSYNSDLSTTSQASGGPIPSCVSNGTEAKAGSCVVPPRVVYSPAPESTTGAGAAKYSGTATLQLVVTTDGMAENIKILKSLGPELDKKAIDAVSRWRFEPATKGGKPVATEIVVEVKFDLY
jgi:TonB family protein